MLTEKQRRQKAQEREHRRQLLCTKCGTKMTDIEPGSPKGEFDHPKNGCVNGGYSFDWEVPKTMSGTHSRIPRHGKYIKDPARRFGGRYVKGVPVSGIVQMNYSSKERRARKRGAKLASKHRPR